MNQIRLLFLLMISCLSVYARTSSLSDRIFISVLLPEQDNFPAEATRQLELKLNQLLMQNGIANDDPNNSFVLTTKVSVITKDIVAGAPQKISMNLDFTFIIGNAEMNKKFESVTLSSVGVGINENKAFIAAIRNIKPHNPKLVKFVQAAKNEIIEYYTLACSQIQKKAAQEASRRNYEQAIYLLMQIPDVCDCAYECQNMAIQYSQECLNNNAAQLLNQAKSLWVANPDASGASGVADILAQIPANTASQQGIDRLISEIKGKLKADQKKDWDFKIQQYNDRIEKQKRDDQARLEQQRADIEYRDKQQSADNNYRNIQQAADNEARTQAIETARQIGIAYSKNQPQSVTYQGNVILW